MNTSRRTQLTPDIVCLRADNASAMTGAGTNSYVVFGAGGAVVIDPGPDLDCHFDTLLEVIGPQPLAAILITHPHADHSALAPRLAGQTRAPVASFGAAACPHGGGEGVDHSHQPDILLQAGQAEFAGLQFTILHTPGHMQGHLCFGYKDILFSGDHVMGWSTSLISPPEGDMAAYRRSLRALQGAGYTRYFSGHGTEIDDPEARLRDLIDHRAAREAQILTALGQRDMSAQHLAAQIYSDLPPALLNAAALNVLAHLIELAQTARARPHTKGNGLSPTTIFSLSPP